MRCSTPPRTVGAGGQGVSAGRVAAPERGNGASRRGGPLGFVRTDGETLWWPDYPGNNMFNSFGNLAADPTAALLFVDFRTGHTLHLSGTATVRWNISGDPDGDGHTGTWCALCAHARGRRAASPCTRDRLRLTSLDAECGPEAHAQGAGPPAILRERLVFVAWDNACLACSMPLARTACE